MVAFLGVVAGDHDHPEMKKITVLERVTILGMVTILEYGWLRCMTLHDLILCYYCQLNLSTS